ncbi:MATE family efflux transporter [Neptunicella marina]|uniref:Multidrug-efflux transporter n=1 Tax=Neptunicella marina TaxID=2125989 RepID=A0A8J6IPK6_9ALTE|nr:MATE family efflux transporter [Neptunicella marina]MBC3764404.1 MATE family efflux transporter [Neptunicella marina]
MSLKTEVKALLHLAWPLLIAQITQTLMGVSDTIMAGQVSASDMAAVAIASSVIFPLLFFIQGIILALPPIISRLKGANTPENIAVYTQQTAWLALFISLPISCSYSFIPELIALVPMELKLQTITAEYLQYMVLGVPFFALYQVARNYCEGLSLTRPSMVIMGIGLMVNIPANYIFIYGKLGVTPMGGAGCGIATALVFTCMMIATIVYTLVAKQLKNNQLYAHLFAPDMAKIREVLSQGIPIAMAILFEVSLFAAVALLLSPFGATVVAAHQIALNFSSLMFMVPLSLGMATTIRIGHRLGEKREDLANKAVKSAWLVGAITATCTATLSVILRYPIAELYSNESHVINMAADLMMLAAMFQFSDALQVISGCALRGYKDAKAMFYITFISYWLIGLSTGCILGLTDWIVPAMQARGFWIGFIVGLTAAAVFLSARLIYIQRTLDINKLELSDD